MIKQLSTHNKELDKMLLIQSRQATFGTMIDTISHQWKQPLNEIGLQVMHLNSKILYENKMPTKEELLDFTSKSDNILDFMSKTVDTFRNFFKSSDDISYVNISEKTEDILLFFEETFKTCNIKVHSNIQKNIYYPCLQEEFSHAILNILVNAKDIFIYRKIKDPSLYISLKQENNIISITIQDNGGGIKLSPERSIFDIHTSDKGGSGLGLYITKKIIEEKMQGKLNTSNKNDGAEFILTLHQTQM